MHLTDRDGLPLCPEAARRDAMSDAEFWEHVLQPEGARADYESDIDDDEMDERNLERLLAGPCPECGQHGACAYDVDGRPLIHLADTDD